jgi:uncharacterized membrane protein YfcA
MATATILAALLSGGLIGIVLGLVGGGGSILAVPLLAYVVHMSPSPPMRRSGWPVMRAPER